MPWFLVGDGPDTTMPYWAQWAVILGGVAIVLALIIAIKRWQERWAAKAQDREEAIFRAWDAERAQWQQKMERLQQQSGDQHPPQQAELRNTAIRMSIPLDGTGWARILKALGAYQTDYREEAVGCRLLKEYIEARLEVWVRDMPAVTVAQER